MRLGGSWDFLDGQILGKGLDHMAEEIFDLEKYINQNLGKAT